MSATLAAPPWTPTDRQFHRFSVDDYHRMGDAGIFPHKTRIHLLEGLIVWKWPPWGSTDLISNQYRFSVDQYHRLAEAGILTKRDRVVLLEGLLVKKMTIHPPHATAVENCYKRLLFLVFTLGWTVRSQQPVVLGASEPEPDVAVVRGTDTIYTSRHPTPPDFGILIEVADSTLRFDRVDWARIYGSAGIPVYWVVNLVDRQVEMMTLPNATGYAQQDIYLPGQAVPVVLDGVVVGHLAVDDLLP